MEKEKYCTIRYRRDDSIGILTLARPEKHNAQSPQMWSELRGLGRQLLDDREVRCLVIEGEGPSFSSGIDVVEGFGGLASNWDELTEDDSAFEAAGTFSWIPKLPFPSVAAVHGHAYGAGLQLALACDFRVIAEGATMGLLETKYGLFPDMGGTIYLPRIVGESKARELILLAEVFGASEAQKLGLCYSVVTPADLHAAVMNLAGRLAAQPPLALRGARRALEASWYSDSDTSLRVAIKEQMNCVRSRDFQEGLQAKGEGRAPVWQGM